MQRIPSFLLLLFLPLAALADGMVIPTVAFPAKVTIPDQRALICFTNGTERLVIETRFTGTGTNFAWVVPLPSQPVIEEATTGLFPTLQYLFQPKIAHDVPKHYAWIFALAWVVYFLLLVKPTGRVTLLDIASCLLVGTGIATLGDPGEFSWVPWLILGFIIFLDLLFLVNLARLWNCLPRSLGGAMLAFFLLLQLPLSIALLVDAFPVFCIVLALDVVLVVSLIKHWKNASRKVGTAILISLLAFQFILFVLSFAASATKSRGMSSAASPDQQVYVLDRKIVGIFETTTIAAHDAKELQKWLAENGYATPANAKPVIAGYVKDGWVFVAAKVRRDKPDNETSTPHPLSFTFKTDKPVYPMRLTGVNNGPLSVELYIFGPARAEAPHFKVERCTRPNYPEPPPNDTWSWNWSRWSPETPDIVHPLLRQWVNGSPVVTKLVGTLSPADMRQDVWLNWKPFLEKKNHLFSRSGALITALDWGAGICVAGLLAVYFLARASEIYKTRLSRLVGRVIVTSFALTGLIYLCLPKTEVRLVKGGYMEMESILFHFSTEASAEITNHTPVAAARLTVRNIITVPQTNAPYWDEWSRSAHWANWQNYYLGGPLREEDSPGNYTIREVNGRLEFVTYSAAGAEHIEVLGQ